MSGGRPVVRSDDIEQPVRDSGKVHSLRITEITPSTYDYEKTPPRSILSGRGGGENNIVCPFWPHREPQHLDHLSDLYRLSKYEIVIGDGHDPDGDLYLGVYSPADFPPSDTKMYLGENKICTEDGRKTRLIDTVFYDWQSQSSLSNEFAQVKPGSIQRGRKFDCKSLATETRC